MSFVPLGSVFMNLQIIWSIISSAPPPIDVKRPSLNCCEIGFSAVNPIPPQNWRHESAHSLISRPVLSLPIEANCVTSSPWTY